MFSITDGDDLGVLRHLSISRPGSGHYPGVIAVLMIATELFGFTGWDGKSLDMPEGWLVDAQMQCGHHIAVVAQLISSGSATKQ